MAVILLYFWSNENKEITKKFNSEHLALGILPDDAFDGATEFASCEGNNAVVLYSDGLIEAENAEGKEFDEDMLIDVLKSEVSAPKLRNNIVDAVSKHLDGEKAHDDISLVVVNTQLNKDD